MSFQNEIVKAIHASMPSAAELRVIESAGGFYVGVSWKLNDDPERPNKMSKTISILVSDEAAQDFASASIANQEVAYQRINLFLSDKLASFDPQHGALRHEPPPVDQWVIGSSLLFG
jgi:hypothetical protein